MNSQIDAANDAADALHRKMYPEQYKDDQVDQNAPAPAVIEPAPVVDPDAPKPPEPVDPNAVPPVVPVVPAAPAIPDPNAPAPVNEPAPAAPILTTVEDWEQKYKVLQGKYDAEVPRTVAEKKELQGLLNQAIATINQINASRVPVEPTNTPSTISGVDVSAIKLEDLTGPELNALKEDYPDIYNALNGIVAKLNEQTVKISQEIKGIKNDQNASIGTVFKSDLSRLVPDWQEIKNDPEFSVWLSQTEKFSGRPYYELATLASQETDAARLAGFYNGFKESKKISPAPPMDPGPAAPALPAAPAAPVIPDPALKNLSPPRSQNTPTPPAEPKNNQSPKITKSFIQKFYQDAVKGVFTGRDAEYAAIEAQIHEATRTRKVLPG